MLGLIVLDGFGVSEVTEHNAIAKAHTPCWDRLWSNAPHTTLLGSGERVGLPQGQMGNSEVGHLCIGAGRIPEQSLVRISKAVESKAFQQHPELKTLSARIKQTGHAIHILGLLSPGGVHSHETHLFAAIEAVIQHGVEQVYVHAFLDGRDMPPKSAHASLERLQAVCDASNGKAHIASLIGRYYAMDRDTRWERTEKAYRLLTEGVAEREAPNALAALETAYATGETDEFVMPTRLLHTGGVLQAGDGVVCMNFRADRMRQLTQAFVNPDFSAFSRPLCLKPEHCLTLTEYSKDLPATVLYPPDTYPNVLGECLANAGLSQLRIAETEKYAHVTFFMNGGVEAVFPGEERILIESPKVATYDLQPEMSAAALTDALVEKIETRAVDTFICNFANADMVGHTGCWEATVRAIETLDVCLQRIVNALDTVQGGVLITADHGNAECMQETGQPHTAHTCSPVPLVYAGAKQGSLQSGGSLQDIAPTFLSLLGLPIPKEMTGQSLWRSQPGSHG